MVPADRMQVVETLAEAQVLAAILSEYEASRPQPLHPLVAECFQVRPNADLATRFRAPGDPGVFYGAGAVKTAAAEVAYWRHRFITRSTCRILHGVFHLDLTAESIDLRAPPFNSVAAAWLHPHDYSAPQLFAATAREAGVACIMYQSVRFPTPAMCAAVLSPEPLAGKVPTVSRRSWELTITRQEAIWRQTPFGESFAFPIASLTQTDLCDRNPATHIPQSG
jgi:RES domain